MRAFFRDQAKLRTKILAKAPCRRGMSAKGDDRQRTTRARRLVEGILQAQAAAGARTISPETCPPSPAGYLEQCCRTQTPPAKPSPSRLATTSSAASQSAPVPLSAQPQITSSTSASLIVTKRHRRRAIEGGSTSAALLSHLSVRKRLPGDQRSLCQAYCIEAVCHQYVMRACLRVQRGFYVSAANNASIRRATTTTLSEFPATAHACFSVR